MLSSKGHQLQTKEAWRGSGEPYFLSGSLYTQQLLDLVLSLRETIWLTTYHSSGLRVRPWAWPLRPAYFSGPPLTRFCFYTLKYLKVSFWVLLAIILLSGMGETQQDWQEENEQRQPGVSTGMLKNKTKTPFWQAPERESQKCRYHIAKAGSRGHCALGECSIPLKISVLFTTAMGSFSPVIGGNNTLQSSLHQ